MYRPFSDIRPLGPFAKTIRDRQSNDKLWVMHRIDVQKPNADISDVKEGRVIREFGGMETISESADDLVAAPEDLTEAIPSMHFDIQGIVEYDIMPSTKPEDPSTGGVGVRLIYHIFEGFDVSDDDIENTRDAPITHSYLEEQGQYYVGELENYYPDGNVIHGGSGVSSTRPAPEDGGTVIYFTG